MMRRKEYLEYLDYELYGNKDYGFKDRVRIKYFQPNTNCVYLCRKMWYLYSCGGGRKLLAKFIYLRIYHKYGCCIYPEAEVKKGFAISHPVCIVIGGCRIGENFKMYQNCTIGTRKPIDAEKRIGPHIGDNVTLFSGSLILGDVEVGDNCKIGASSLVLHSIRESGVYAGNPLRKIN